MKIKWYGDNCKQCKGLNEPYMVTDKVWKKANNKENGFLCISCLESNLGRALIASDFINAPINKGYFLFNSKDYLKYGKKYLELCHNFIKGRSHVN